MNPELDPPPVVRQPAKIWPPVYEAQIILIQRQVRRFLQKIYGVPVDSYSSNLDWKNICAICLLPEYATAHVLYGVDDPETLLEYEGGHCSVCNKRICPQHLDHDGICIECEIYK